VPLQKNLGLNYIFASFKNWINSTSL